MFVLNLPFTCLESGHSLRAISGCLNLDADYGSARLDPFLPQWFVLRQIADSDQIVYVCAHVCAHVCARGHRSNMLLWDSQEGGGISLQQL